MNYKQSEPVLSSYATFQAQCWNVSTIYRQSSAAGYSGRYYETIVWEWDTKTYTRGRMVLQEEGIDAHCAILGKIIREGAFWDKKEEDE